MGRTKKGLAGLDECRSWYQLFVNALGGDSDVSSSVNFKSGKRVISGLQEKWLRVSQSLLLLRFHLGFATTYRQMPSDLSSST